MNGVLADVDEDRVYEDVAVQKDVVGAACDRSLTLQYERLQQAEPSQVPVLQQSAVQLGGELDLLAEPGGADVTATAPLAEEQPRLLCPDDQVLLLLGQLPVRQEGAEST